MLFAKKTVFAGKRNLQPEPFCPVISSKSGYASLMRGIQPKSQRRGSASRYR